LLATSVQLQLPAPHFVGNFSTVAASSSHFIETSVQLQLPAPHFVGNFSTVAASSSTFCWQLPYSCSFQLHILLATSVQLQLPAPHFIETSVQFRFQFHISLTLNQQL
jgi:hypothetical protein